MRPRAPLTVFVAAVLLLVPALAGAHSERSLESLARGGSVPDPDRAPSMVLDVCKTGECDYEDIQAAVNDATDGALIRIWPGLYEELPSRAAPDYSPPPASGDYLGLGIEGDYGGGMSFEDQLAYPNAVNLVAILGKHDITLRGMGDDPGDVVIDVAFAKHVGIRADRADGVVFQNFQVWHAVEHGVYAMDLDGAWLDHVGGFYSGEYELFYYAMDHGVMRDCEAVGGGDSGIYIGGSPVTPGRFTTEVADCWSHHNVLGYSGTQGNYVWVHDNLFEDNAIGLVSDSETDHPNYPQRGSVLERNVFADNDFDVYDGDCSDGWCSDVAPEAIEGVVFPVGTGVFFPGNNDNTLEDNVFVRNPRAAVWLASGQGVVIGPTSDPAAPPFVSSGNRFLGNSLVDNGVDFMWDGLGVGNCWEGNERSDDAEPTTDGAILPPCSVAGADLPATASAPNPGNAAAQAGLLIVEGPDGSRPACHYTGTTPCGGDHDVATWPTVARNRAAGYVPPPTPPSCGPSDDATCWS